ncbi:DNA glycosylase [Macrophomina phaseolina]|uniref:DNA glycosylase n=1 Tax=Macrophomina phaseolina TaxID=35725 RepID=A0ABQ8G6F6_9PEZI|nr:DNA glycosylase [Macrophomina phaseolina]
MSGSRRSARLQASHEPINPAKSDTKAKALKPRRAKKAEKQTATLPSTTKKRGRPSKTADAATNDKPIITASGDSNRASDTKIVIANSDANVFVTPITPTTKRRKTAPNDASPIKPPPFTPTPSIAGLMASNTNTNPPSSSPLKPRPVDPHATNAPLSVPGGSRVVPHASTVADDETTTENLLEKACAHLISVDPRLRTVIDKHYCKVFSPEGLQEEVDPFKALVSGILSQQVSGAAAKSIQNKFIALFSNSNDSSSFFPSPAQVAAAELSLLRTAGLSGRKAEYVKGLAEKFASGELSAQMLVEASDAEVLEKLVAVRGLGRWSVEMFACFALKRTDVFSTGDLGVQRGMAAWLGKDVAKLKANGKGGKWKYLSEKEMLDRSAPFAPYRSLFMWYMWRIEDVNIDALQGS